MFLNLYNVKKVKKILDLMKKRVKIANLYERRNIKP